MSLILLFLMPFSLAELIKISLRNETILVHGAIPSPVMLGRQR